MIGQILRKWHVSSKIHLNFNKKYENAQIFEMKSAIQILFKRSPWLCGYWQRLSTNDMHKQVKFSVKRVFKVNLQS